MTDSLMNIYKERDLRNGCAGLFLYVLQSNGFESFFNGRLRLIYTHLTINRLKHFRKCFVSGILHFSAVVYKK